MTTTQLNSIIIAATRFERELRQALTRSRWARDRRYRMKKAAKEAERRTRTADALRAEFQA